MVEEVELRKSVPVVANVDVLVVGAGIAGCTAAVAAARNGASTMVVDRFGYPGGNMGPGMVGGAPCMEVPEDMGGRLTGIPGEFIARCEAYCNAPLLAHYFRDSQVISYVWTRMMQESGVTFMYNTYAGDPIMDGSCVTGLFVENKNGTQAIRARVVVDATGDADVAARAGAPMDGGKRLFHAGTYFAMANVDVDRYVKEVFEKDPSPEDVEWAEGIYSPAARSQWVKPLLPYYRAAWEAGEYRFFQEIDGLGHVYADHGLFRAVSGVQDVEDPLRCSRHGIIGALVGVHRNHEPTSGDTAVMTAIEVKCRSFIFETAQFLAHRMPGFVDSYLHIIAPYFNSRGGRSIRSEYPVSAEDVAEEREFDDVVFRARHKLLGLHPVRYQTSYDFPYRQFLPRGVDGLLVTGRACIVQPPVMRIRWMVLLMGQATGAAAALAADAGVAPRELDIRRLQKVLHDVHQAPLGSEDRLMQLGLDPGA